MSDSLVTGRRRQTATAEPAAPDSSGGVPPFFDLVVVVIIAVVLSFGSIGVLLAFFGHDRPAIVFPVGAVLSIGLIVLGARRLPGRAPLSVLLPTVGMLIVAAVSAVSNAILDGHYVQVDRDPGVYAVAARWIAQHGSLEVQAGLPWISKGIAQDYSSAGLYPEGNGRLEFQFAHFMPVLMAQGHNIAGDRLMFAIPALVGALSLCVVYAVGCRLLRRPWLALVAVIALGLSLPQLLVSRDSYSETTTQLLLWGAAWALLRAWDARSPRLALFAGLVLGGAMATRIDAFVYLIPIPFLLALAWLSARGAQRRTIALGIGAVVIGCVPDTVLGFFDVSDRGGGYYKAASSQAHDLQHAVEAAVVLSILLVLLWPRLSRHQGLWAATRRWSTLGLPPLAILVLLALWKIRPRISTPETAKPVAGIEALQRAAGLPIDGRRTYAEQSLNWLSSYLGTPAVALAILGAAVLLAVAIRRANPAAMVVLGMAGFGTALYIWAPSITPDQVFAARRYVPAGLPLLTLSAAVGVEAIAQFATAPARGHAPKGRSFAPFIAPVGAVLALIFPLLTLAPVWNFSSQANFITLIDQTCAMIGPKAAVLFTAQDFSGRTLNQTMESFCDADASSEHPGDTPAEVSLAAARWRAAGRTLWVMSYSSAGVSDLAPAPAVVRRVGSVASTTDLGEALNKAPSDLSTRVLTLYAAQVPLAAHG